VPVRSWADPSVLLSTMLSTLLSIGDPPDVTTWTRAKRLGAVSLNVFTSMRFVRNDW
jgi:hypothetical protein